MRGEETATKRPILVERDGSSSSDVTKTKGVQSRKHQERANWQQLDALGKGEKRNKETSHLMHTKGVKLIH